MQKAIRFVGELIPGFVLALAIATVAYFTAQIQVGENVHGAVTIGSYIGASVIALFIGMVINAIWKPTKTFAKGLKFTSKKVLKFAIILLGASMSMRVILSVGAQSLTVMVFTLLTCFGGGHFIGKALGLDWKLSNLISAGTGICGGSAIAAIAPVIERRGICDERDVPVRYGDDSAVPAAGPVDGTQRRGVRPVGGYGGQRYVQRGCGGLCLFRGRGRLCHHG